MDPQFFSYVVDHDFGFAPNPENDICTAVHFKYQGRKRRKNVVELAEVGDWILGSGGVGPYSAGNGKIISLMRVDEKPTFAEYLGDERLVGRNDRVDRNQGN